MIKLNEKHANNQDRSFEFIKAYYPVAIEICTNFLRNDGTRTKGKAAWEEISSILRCIVDITKYRVMPSADTIQEIASACLNDNNRWELREIGFNLLLNLLNTDMNLQVPNFLILAALDFSQIRGEESKNSSYFPDRNLLTTPPPNQQDNTWINLVRNPERSESIQNKYLQDLEKIAGATSLNKPAKDCIYFLNRTLEYAAGNEYSSKPEHFSRWFGMLKKTVLFLLYPHLLVPGEEMVHDCGFREVLPPILHYIIVKWLVLCIRSSELNSVLIEKNSDFEFITKVIGKSFFLTESYSSICYESASICIKLYEE